MAIEYINKEYYQTIPKTERRYLNVGSQENAAAVIAKLKEANISFSASIGSRNTITLSGDNNLKIAKEYLADIANASTRNVIGNAAYRALSDKKYIKTDAETANILNSMLAGDNNIKFSGIIQGDSATITVSGNDNVNLVKRLISNIRNKELFEHITDAGFTRLPDKEGFINFKNNATGEVCGFDNVDMIKEMFYDENNEFFHPTIFRIELTSDAFEDIYYISAVDSTTLEEKHPYNTDDGMPTFSSIAEAISYAAANGIEYTNSNDEIEKWKAIDEEIAAENDLFKQNRELIKRFPEQNGEYPNDFMYNPDSNSYSWVYFNPDGDNGNGEFVEITVTENDVFEAYQKQLISEQNASGENAFIDYLYSICKENIIDAHSGYFEGYADSYINKPGIVNRFYDSTDMTAMIDYLKINNHLIKNTTSAITAESDNIRLDGYTGSWYVIDNEVIDGKELFLLESEIYGDETACIIIDSSRNVVMDDVWNGFGDYRERFDVKELTAEEKFAAKVIAEWEAFRNRMSKESPDVLINSAYEISTKEQIKNYIETEPLDLTKQQLNALEERDNILDELYSEWIGNKYLHSYSDVETLLTNTADLISESVNRTEEKSENGYEWNIIPESIDEETGKPSVWSTEINSEKYGKFLWITQSGEHLYNVEYNPSGERFVPLSEDSVGFYSMADAATWVDDNLPDMLNSVPLKEEKEPDEHINSPVGNLNSVSSNENAVEIEREYVNVPVYAKSIAEARMNDEIELFRASQNANAACARDIDEALSRNYNNNSIDSKTALSELLEKYSSERIELVVAVNIASRPWDGRISRENKEWANEFLANFASEIRERPDGCYLTTHPGLLNLFANTVRSHLEKERELAAEQSQEKDEIYDTLDLKNNSITFSVITIEDEKPFVVGDYIDKYDITALEEYQDYIYDTGKTETDVKVEYYLIGSGDNESFGAYDDECTYISEHLDEVLAHRLTDNLESETYSVATPAELLDEINEEKGIAEKEAEEKSELDSAKEYIRNYLEKEFLSENVTFDDLEHISAGYTELGENNEYGFQMEIDLINLKIRYMLDDELVKEESYDSLEKMNELALSGINFDEFYSIGTDAISEAIKVNEIAENDNTPKYYIYQIPAGERYRDIRFTSFDHLQIMGQLPDRMNYENVYSGELMDINNSDKLEGIFTKFNLEHPDDFKGHSLSVSDIIVIEDENGKSAHFVNDVGFKDITDIFFEHERKAAEVEQLNINDYENIRLVSRSEWNDYTLGDDENPAFEEISVAYTPDEDGSFTKYAHNTTNSNLVDVWDEENSVSADELLENIANHLKMMGQDKANSSYHIELTDYAGNFHKLESNNYSFVQEDTQREQSEMTAPDVELEKSIEEGIIGSMGYPIDEMDKAFEAENSRTDYGNEAVSARKKPGDKIEIGDRFLYKDREYTVTSEKGIYPDDIGISYFDTLSNGRKYEVTENVDKNKLLREGEYLGNDINQTSEKTTADATRDNSIPDKYLEKIEQNEKENIEFAESLSEFLSNTTPNNTHITIGRTPNSLILAGATPELDLIIRPDTIVKCMREATADEHGHLLTEEMLKALPDELRNPTIILKGSHESSIVAVTELKDKENREIIVSVEFNSRQDFGVVNRITSAYGKDNFQKYLIREIYEKNNLIAVNKNKANKMLQSFGLQLPAEETFISFDNSIAYTLDNVKFTTTNKEKADKMSSSTRLQLPAGNNIISSNKSIAHTLDNVKYPDEKIIANEEKSIESNDMQSEQLSLFSNAPSRKSVDEVFTELSNGSENEISENNADVQETHGQDFVINSDDFNEKKAGQGEKARYADNVAAIRLLKKIEGENRKATPDEQEILAKYVGWGGIQNAFDSSRNEWRNEYAELKELLNEAEYKAARASTNNAHFTSPVIINAIYNGLRNIGFNGGKILEPSAGTGNFFGAMPDDLKNGSELFGVELDSITGRIAQQLYQSADIKVNGFEKTTFENNSFDAVVSNVPFGDYKLYDREYNHLNLNIHDYFFAKALDKVHPGGVVAFVTSSGTMDKQNSEVRKYLAERAELLGAIRLPNNAFKGIAGTEVTSDIIFLQKREYPIAINENNASWLNRQINDDGIVINQYFAEHPEMVLGKMVEGNKMYGSGTTCMPIEGANLKEQLAEAVKNIQGQYKEYTPKQKNEKTQPTVTAPADVKTFSYAILDDKLYFRKGGTEMEEVTGKELERCKAMTEIRDTVRKLLNMQIKNIDGNFEADIVSQRQLLNTKYDDFVSKFGLLTSKHNAAVYKADASYNLLKALEKTDSDGNFIGKADVFTRNTINPIVLKDHVDTADEALILSVAEKLTVDMQYMQEITGMTEEQLVSELVGKIYQNPAKGMQWESADEYLTGNVRQKLKEAIAANMPGNVAALERVIPEKIEAQDIAVKLGASWIDPEYIREFVIDEFRPDWSTQRSLTINYSKYTDTWSVDGYSGNFNIASNETYGDWGKRFCGYKLLEMALNMKKPEVKKELVDPETKEVVRDVKGNVVKTLDAEATAILQSKQEALVKRFSEWLMDDPTRREALVEKYNEMFNSIRHREYDGSHLNFVGINKEIELKPHQKDAIARALYSGNTLLAHEVGAGKTYEMVAIAMEGKRLGLHNKALFAVPKHLTEQTGQAFRELYPNCNILVATEKDFERKNRQELLAKIATGDYDAIIIGHSQFDRIHLSPEKEQQYITDELEMLRNALEEMSSDGKKSFSVKQIESAIKKKEKHLEELKDMIKADDFIEFEQLGVDKIFIDESQNYKNLGIVTKMQNVAGLGSGESAKASQLLMKCKYLDELTGNKGIVFASGTPISNSMTEMYSLMRYLQADKLESVGITSFDRWASVFGETKTEMELKPTADGQYQLKTRFAKFSNLPELMGMFKECADIKTAATLDLDRPDRHDHTIVVEPNRYQQKYIKNIGERAEAIHSGTIDPRIDNMLKITTDGRKIGLDSRCIDPNAPDDPGSKVNTCIENVYRIWEETAENRSTQMIFCDLATPQAPINESTYIVYRKDENGDYAPIYSDKLKANEGVSEIFKKLSEKPSKEFIAQADVLRDTDIILTKEVNVKEELSYNNMGIIQQGKIKAVPDTSTLYDKIGVSPISTFESEKRFCVYDDIRNKLIAKGIPKEEIAFIHEYEKAADKQKLFEKMNKGEVRIMLGSTQKCGAGMNAQKKMIALHDLDAPLRPSDMGQRHGRIERQGNENKDIDIYRYVTNKTFDAYIYQTLENKQKFISQIMTEKSPVRSCDDIDELVLDYAETKALCAGNPLIKERLTLQTEIKQLEVLKSGYLSQRYALQKVIADYPDNKANYENRVAKIEQDISRVEEPMVNEEGKKYNPITIGDKTYADKEEGGQAMRKAISDNMEALYSGRAVTIGKYRGFELSVAPNGQELNGRIRINLCLTGETKHYCDVNLDTTVQAGGNIVRLNNLINGFESELTNAQEKLENLNTNYETTKEKVDKPFEKEAELNAKQQRLKEVEAELMSASSINVIDTSEIYNQIVSICPALETDESVYQIYKAQGYEPLSIEKEGNACVIMHTYEQNGDLMYDPAITFNIDTENHTIEVTSFEQSGLGMYEDFRDNASGLKDCVEFFEQWLDNISQQGFKAIDMSAEKEEEPDIEPETPQYNNYSIR